MTSAELIRRVGTALYGERYETELALALGVNRRTVRRWKSGECQPQEGVWRDVAGLLVSRGADLETLASELRRRW